MTQEKPKDAAAPVEGVAVWLYPYGYRCEQGPTKNGSCIHIEAVKRYDEHFKVGLR